MLEETVKMEALDARTMLSAATAWTHTDAPMLDSGDSVVAHPMSVTDFAPTSINSLQFTLVIRSSTKKPLSGSYHLLISKHGHDFVATPGTAAITANGPCSYTKNGVNAGTIAITDNTSATTGTFTLTFTVSRGGTYRLNMSNGLYQRGTFTY